MKGAGEPLLFVHGNPTWSFYWRNLILGLRDRYRCIAVDHIGCGLSDKPQDYNYTLQQRIDDLVRAGRAAGFDGRDAAGARLGRRDRPGDRPAAAGAVCADRAVQHGRVSAAVCAVADRRLPHAALGHAGRARLERVRPRAR